MEVKILRERYSSPNYRTITKPNGSLCKPVVIDIRKASLGWFSHERPSASRDIELLKETFQRLGFSEPYLVSDKDSSSKTDPLYSKENLKGELQSIASNEKITKDSELFICVVLAFGDSGYFYLPNDPTDFEPKGSTPPNPKFYTSDLLSYFKGDVCPSLILKPKIFLIQTCDINLKQRDRSQFMGEDLSPRPQLHRVPTEADLLIYHSVVSGGYTDKMKPETKKTLGDVIDQVENGKSACQFVYTLHKEVKLLTDGAEEFEWTDLILRVNHSLMEFIEKEHYRSDIPNEPWNKDPQVPVCVDQLTKKLVLKTR